MRLPRSSPAAVIVCLFHTELHPSSVPSFHSVDQCLVLVLSARKGQRRKREGEEEGGRSSIKTQQFLFLSF